MQAEEELSVANPNMGFAQNPTVEGISDSSLPLKKKRNLPGTPDPEAEVIALSPKTLMATNRFLCEICGKGFQRDQNLQLHRRGHNLPWKLKQRSSKEPKKRVYVCPEKTCVHHHPSRALGDLTGIKKHFCRKHGEKKWKCDKCSKRYAVQSDWKAHSKTCGTREYKCDCGTLFSRRDSFITHRAFCDALAEETARVRAASSDININNPIIAAGNISAYHFMGAASQLGPTMTQHFPSIFKPISTANDGQTPVRGLSLWMGEDQAILGDIQNQIHHHHQQLGTVVSSGSTMFADHRHQSPHPQSDYHHHHQQQLSWVFGTSKISSPNAATNAQEQIASTTSVPLRNSVKELGGQANIQPVSVPSLYSTQHTNNISHQTLNSVNMSATALLQKAAQIGTTSSESSFLGSFGLKCNNSNAAAQAQDGSSKSCGLYGSDPIPSAENPEGVLPIYPPAKRRHVQNGTAEDSGGAGGQTRDFLGVGVQTICHPSPINGWI